MKDSIGRTIKEGSGYSCSIIHSTTGEMLAIGTSLDPIAAIGRAFAKLFAKTFRDSPQHPSAEWIVRVRLEEIA